MPNLKYIIPTITAFMLMQNAHCAYVASYKGGVEYKKASSYEWKRLEAAAAQQLAGGDEVRTKSASTAEIMLDAGSMIRLGPASAFKLSDENSGTASLELYVGRLRAWVKKFAAKLEVRTPTAVCSVRGTEFSLEVDPQTSHTRVDLFRGTLAVRDNLGNELLLQEGRRISVTPEGLGVPQQISKALENERRAGMETLTKEVGLAMSKEAVLGAAASEIKLAEYQQGKSLIDVFGNRVQLEEYVMRPAADQFKLVVLNKRESRLDYFFYKGTFNAALPADLSLALKTLGGAPQSPSWWLTAYQTGRSNTIDTVEENASGGHTVDVNGNLDTSDDVASWFDSATDLYVPVTGAFYKTLFDYYSIKYNGTQTYAWVPNAPGVQSYLSSDVTTSIYGGNANYAIDSSFPDGTFLHNRILETYGTGDDFTQYDNYIIDNDGKPASVTDFAGVTSGPQYKEALLKWNFQQVIASSFFGGRKIDLVVEPKILIQSGLVQ
ncbi:MAG: FecR domain-containing protein [Elusimicrobia bacterium]|nr:FecR domain-containing protein [Elusimicrobiota bacterium]